MVFGPSNSERESGTGDVDMVEYLGKRLGRPAELIRRSSYSEENELLRSGYCDLALVSGYAYLVGQRDFGLEPVAVPLVKGDSQCCSYLIVGADSPAGEWSDLLGKTFAFTDPLSTSGYVAPRYELMLRGETPDSFFRRTIFTYGDDNSVRAVAEKLVDAAAVESLAYDRMAALSPGLLKKTKIIARSEHFGAPLVVVNSQMSRTLREQLREAFLDMNHSPVGRTALEQIGAERFISPDPHLYDWDRDMSEKMLVAP